MEEIVVRRNNAEIFHGTVPAGFAMHLSVGDSVLYRRLQGGKLVKKWDIRLYRGVPHLRFGESYGKANKYIRLEEEDNE